MVRGSVSTWIDGLKGQDAEAAAELWRRYSSRLVALAKSRLRDIPSVVSDEDDIAQSTFAVICRGAASGRFGDVRNRDDLWWLLVATVRRKTADFVRRETAVKRGAGETWRESTLAAGDGDHDEFTLDGLIGEVPTPDYLASFDEERKRLFALLRDDSMRQVASARLEGYSVEEIAGLCAMSQRSVERKLQMIRRRWARCVYGESDADV